MLYNQFLENFLLPIGDRLFGLKYLHYLKQYRAFCQWSEEAILELQHERLQETLSYAVANSPFYKKLNLESKKDPFQWLKEFPIIEKKGLRKFEDKLITSPKGNLIKMSTSGSSGFQSNIYMTNEELSQHRANQTLWWEWSGFKIGEPLIQTGMATKRGLTKGLKDFFFRTQYVLAFNHQREEILSLFNRIKKTQNYFLVGYASSLYSIAKIALDNNIREVQFRAVVSWGDKLFSHYRKAIEKAFSTKVWETYGTAEGLMIAAQYDNSYLYEMTPNVYLELLDNNGNEVENGEIGHVVVTSLVARGMPLIRYKVGDLAVKLPKIEYPSKKIITFSFN